MWLCEGGEGGMGEEGRQREENGQVNGWREGRRDGEEGEFRSRL